MDSERSSVSEWLAAHKDGDLTGATKIWERYYARLVGLARDQLRGTSRRVADEEDVALNAFASFCDGVAKGRFPRLEDRDDLWRVLLKITQNEATDHKRREWADKRGAGNVRGDSAFENPGAEHAGSIDDKPDLKMPTPEEAVAAAEQCARLLGVLDADLRQLATLKLEGWTNREIAKQLKCFESTVERRLGRIRKEWASLR